MRRSWQPASAFSRAGRSGGRPALQLPRTSNPAEVLHPAPFPTAHRRSRKFPFRYYLRSSGEVWRAPGPPAPPSNIPVRQVRHTAFILFAHHRTCSCSSINLPIRGEVWTCRKVMFWTRYKVPVTVGISFCPSLPKD